MRSLSILLGAAMLLSAPLAQPQAPAQATAPHADVLAPLLPSVVAVRVEQAPPTRSSTPFDEFFGLNGKRADGRERRGSGTAFVVDASAGLLVTTSFVVADATSIEIVLDGDRAVPATVVAADEDTQLAVLRVDAAALRGLAALTWGDSRAAQVGDAVVMVGFPYDLGRLASRGIVSGTSTRVGDGREYLITDARILPGHAGGPLLDARGRVVGVAVAVFGTPSSTPTAAIGITVPSAIAQPAVESLKQGPLARGTLGVDAVPPRARGEDAAGTETPPRGALIERVVPGSGAAAAGLQIGDVIIRVDAEEITDADALRRYIRSKPPGAVVRIAFRRGGEEQVVSVTLGPSVPR
ncbi:MAG: S1C family serine protease [Gemmatimonadaceae bacterium]|jgi:S1-C subfamily serine protease|nr:S1C family serine protease [Gemmatimonadaceae bacterium]